MSNASRWWVLTVGFSLLTLDLLAAPPPKAQADITAVYAGVGLTGGGTEGDVTLSLMTCFTTGQVLKWNGTTWVCDSGLNTGVGGSGTAGQLALWTATTSLGGTPALVWNGAGPQLELNGNLALPSTGTGGMGGVIVIGGVPFIHNYAGAGSDGFNTFIGQNAGNFTMGMQDYSYEGSYNTATGANSLHSNTTGLDNTASGYESLYLNTTGSANTASGFYSLYSNTTGSYNTASGYASLYSNTRGYQNTASGFYSLYSNTTGDFNTASGFYSLYSNTTGYFNTASGVASLSSNTTGSNNIALGYMAGYNLTTGNYNIDIGNSGVAVEENTIRIGDSNQTRTFIAGIRGVTTGNADAIAVLIDSNGQLGTVSSSLRSKQDVANMGETSSRLMELRPVTFHYKTHPDGPLQYGLIAEEVEQVMPELVMHDATGQVESVAYHEIPALLLNELQKQHAQIESQKAQIEELRRAVQTLMDGRNSARAREIGGT